MTQASAVIDSEVVAYDRKSNKILPFQQLTTRKHKGVDEGNITVQLCIFAFDLLFLNGQSLMLLPLHDRRHKLFELFNVKKGEFEFAQHKDTDDPEQIQSFLESAMQCSCEGLVVKTLDIDAMYESSKRSNNWLKIKKDYLDGIGDTLDLVLMGASFGTGKRTNVYGSYLLGCFNPQHGNYQSLCKCAIGLSDEQLRELTNKMQLLLVDTKPSQYETDIDCQFWFQPKVIYEIKCADLTISPIHHCGMGLVHPSKGISVRFPRFVRQREDKTVDQTTTSDQVVEMYQNQFYCLKNLSFFFVHCTFFFKNCCCFKMHYKILKNMHIFPSVLFFVFNMKKVD
ncbi:hypothetical protein RFI_18662 [Reticulomyxa filosa]|uniref:DNA ligase 1 n=1 Tax=Reticulomyxa filosa TaxID=46433 RepID=X6MYN9_RETFI|nr:hypothetical protein RFI_18662 [Reticulomyxa filosa]|eukprot:ETO18604.1 hypothetical protein RFI_18662 [Reticulomyxa filosa]